MVYGDGGEGFSLTPTKWVSICTSSLSGANKGFQPFSNGTCLAIENETMSLQDVSAVLLKALQVLFLILESMS